MKEKNQSIIETVRQINNKEELEKQERFEKKNNLQREIYGKKLEKDKKDVLKVKQGIADEDIFNDDNGVKKKYSFSDKVKNFIYHNKWWLGIATFGVCMTAFLAYDTLTTVRSDVRVMLLTDNDTLQMSTDNIHEYFNGHVVDYNEDGRQYTDIVSIPISHNEEDNIKSAIGYENSLTNLSTQFQLAECMMILADSAVDVYIEPETTLENLEEVFPDCPFAKGHKLMLKDTRFAELVGCKNEDIPEDLYLAVRVPASRINVKSLSDEETNQTNYNNAMETLKSVIAELEK